MSHRISCLVALGALALSGCGAVIDPHASAGNRMMGIAARFEEDQHRGGMSGVIDDIQNCYIAATLPVIKVYALRDCMVLDYVGYREDVRIGRRIFHQALPYFEDRAFLDRQIHYAPLDGFQGSQIVTYMLDAYQAVQFDRRQINAGPVIIREPAAN
jgi:hypothetical protein